MIFWSFEVTFSDILVSWGRLSTCLVPGGVQGGDSGEIHLSRGPLLAPFWITFSMKKWYMLRVVFSMPFWIYCLMIVDGFGTTFWRFSEICFQYCLKS